MESKQVEFKIMRKIPAGRILIILVACVELACKLFRFNVEVTVTDVPISNGSGQA